MEAKAAPGQPDGFKDAARAQGCDGDPEGFRECVGKLVKHKPVDKRES